GAGGAGSSVRGGPAGATVVGRPWGPFRGPGPADPSAPEPVREWVRWGVGPRGGQSLLLGAKAWALLDGRTVPAPDDVTRVALPVLRHRLLASFQAEPHAVTPDAVIAKLRRAV